MVAGMFRFDGKVVVITGAAAGIGAAAAKMFSNQGAVVAVTDVNMELAEKTVSDCSRGRESEGFTTRRQQPGSPWIPGSMR